MEKLAHWTQRSVADFVYNISSNFVAQLETRMEEKEISRSELAARMNKSNGRVSQVFNNPGNLSLRVIVEYARTLGMKVSIVAYDDGDSDNKNGPINPEVFVKTWEMANSPLDLFEVAIVDETRQAHMNYLYANVLDKGNQLFKGSVVNRDNFVHIWKDAETEHLKIELLTDSNEDEQPSAILKRFGAMQYSYNQSTNSVVYGESVVPQSYPFYGLDSLPKEQPYFKHPASVTYQNNQQLERAS